MVDGGMIPESLERHADAPRVVIGGGDGTLGSATHALASRGAEFAILPLGTRNHFARQLNIPLASGKRRRLPLRAAGARSTAEMPGASFS